MDLKDKPEKPMKINQYTADLQVPLTQFYNQQISNVRHCYPVDENQLATALVGVTTGKADASEGGLDSETAFVAMKNGYMIAFIHVGLGQIGENREETIGVIRFFIYLRGERHAGQVILERAETYLQKYNIKQIFAFSTDCRYRFYHFEHAGISDALDNVQALIGINKYTKCGTMVFFDWENYAIKPLPSNLPITFTVDWKQGRGLRPNCKIKAFKGEQQVGDSYSVSGGEFSTHTDAQDWLYTDWLEIEDEFQGQGIGHHLLQFTLQEARRIGFKHASISTHIDNHRACLFYGNFGYCAVDRTSEYHKLLTNSLSMKIQ